MASTNTNIGVTLQDKASIGLKNLSNNLKGVDSSVSKLKSSMNGFSSMLGPLAAMGSIAGVVKLGSDAIEAAGHIDDMSVALNMSVASFTQYQYGAKLAGLESAQLEMALRKMNDVVSDAATIGGATKDTLDKLGLSASKLNSLTADQKFDAIADALSRIPNASNRASLAGAIFGDRIGALMLPMINKGIVGIDQFKREADALGITMDEALVKKGAEAGDAIDRLKGQFDGVSRSVALNFGPQVIDVIEKFVDRFVTLKEMVDTNRLIIEEMKKLDRNDFKNFMGAVDNNKMWDFAKAIVLARQEAERLSQIKTMAPTVFVNGQQGALGPIGGDFQAQASLAKLQAQATSLGISLSSEKWEDGLGNFTMKLKTSSELISEILKKKDELAKKDKDIPSESLQNVALRQGISLTKEIIDLQGRQVNQSKTAVELQAELQAQLDAIGKSISTVANAEIKATAKNFGIPLLLTYVNARGELIDRWKTQLELEAELNNMYQNMDVRNMASAGLIQQAKKYQVPVQEQAIAPTGEFYMKQREASSIQADILKAKELQDQALTFGSVAIENLKAGFTDLGNGITEVMGGALTGVYEQLFGLSEGAIMVGRAFGRMVSSVLGSLTAMIAKLLIAAGLTAIISSVFGGGAGATKIIGALNSWAGIGKRASGGPVGMGKPYLVGEMGPELFIPNNTGRIVSNNQLGSGRTVNVTNNITIDSKGDIFSNKLMMNRLASVINDEIERSVKKQYYATA